jgi:hypothetical protein
VLTVGAAKELYSITKEIALLLDYDPRVIEQKELQQPACLPLSYVLRFFSDAARKEGHDAKRKLAQNQGTKTSYSTTTRSNTPTGNLQSLNDCHFTNLKLKIFQTCKTFMK